MLSRGQARVCCAVVHIALSGTWGDHRHKVRHCQNQSSTLALRPPDRRPSKLFQTASHFPSTLHPRACRDQALFRVDTRTNTLCLLRFPWEGRRVGTHIPCLRQEGRRRTGVRRHKRAHQDFGLLHRH